MTTHFLRAQKRNPAWRGCTSWSLASGLTRLLTLIHAACLEHTSALCACWHAGMQQVPSESGALQLG